VALLRPWSRLAIVLGQQGWRTVRESDDFVLLRAPVSWQSDGAAVAPGFGSAG
jgi:hypothetical protein